MITKRAGILFTAYRLADFADPGGFAASVSMVLEDYPDEVIMFCTDPKTGIQRRYEWPPTIANIVKELDNELAHRQRLDGFRNWGKQDSALPEAPRGQRPTLEEMKAKYGPNWGLTPHEPKTGETFKSKSWDAIVEMYRAEPGRINRLADALPRMRGEIE